MRALSDKIRVREWAQENEENLFHTKDGARRTEAFPTKCSMFGHEYGLAVDILNAPTRLYVKVYT